MILILFFLKLTFAQEIHITVANTLTNSNSTAQLKSFYTDKTHQKVKIGLWFYGEESSPTIFERTYSIHQKISFKKSRTLIEQINTIYRDGGICRERHSIVCIFPIFGTSLKTLGAKLYFKILTSSQKNSAHRYLNDFIRLKKKSLIIDDRIFDEIVSLL